MEKYLLSERLHKLLELHKGVFPTKRSFQNYVKNVLRSRFSSDFYSDARNRRPTQYQFLLNLLLYLRDKERQFIADQLGEDWQSMAPEQIAEQHILLASEDYVAPPRSTDTFKLGPTQIATDLFTRIHDDGKCRPATTADLDLLVDQFALGIGDSFNLDFTPPTEISRQEGFEKFGYSASAMRTMLRNAIQYCGNSLWIRPCPHKPEQSLLSLIAPVKQQQYDLFRSGQIDEAEVFDFPPCHKSNRVLLISMLGHARYKGWLAKGKAKTDLMFMVWRQLGLVSENVLDEGLKLLTFQSTEMNNKRLRSWGFQDIRQRTKRTDFPLFELELNPGEAKSAGHAARSIWPLVIVYQSLGKNKPAPVVGSGS